MAIKNEKAMGTCWSPMASILIVMDLWVTLRKIKVKVVKAIDSCHNYPSTANIKHIRSYLSSEFWESAEK